jgi:MoaA/NifB/PqqE/SkfB family radical SAM enzyme
MNEPNLNRGICGSCAKFVPASHVTRDGRVYLVKHCATCGDTEALVSNDAVAYTRKRDFLEYEERPKTTCNLNCPGCNAHKLPTLVFIDVTNRCNMNCPICLANIPAMGFRFDPPGEYFDKIFERLAAMPKKPKIQLFGGEPTVREDLIDIIRRAKEKYGLSARVVTNGLRLADEEYCKKLVATGTELMFSFDGRSPEIYQKTRKHPRAYEKKLKGLENLSKHRKSKVTIMCCVGEGVNDHLMEDMLQFCHEGRHYISALDLIPLTAEWGLDDGKGDDLQSSTIEDVERIMGKAAPGLEFVPAGTLFEFETLRNTFDVGRLTFGGAHPNCESVSIMVSDGEKYNPLSAYLKGSFHDFAREAMELDRGMAEKLKNSWIVRAFGRKGQQFIVGKALLSLIRRSLDMKAVFGDSHRRKALRVVWGMIRGKRLKDLLRKHSRLHGILRLIVLPFEEKECLEAERLVDCPAAFAYEDPDSRQVCFMPVCAWVLHKNAILRQTSENYGSSADVGQDGIEALGSRT